jgi:DNA helicase-2/ATP-dependent DNA helicase PcrA
MTITPELEAFRKREQFDDEQWAAVLADGDVLVTAAAGSGKTRVLVGRILHAVMFQGYDLSNIVAVTFTEKAADEMRQRLAERLAEAGEHEQVAQLEHAQIGTIHSLCGRLLRRFGMLVGVDPGFVVLDETQSSYLRHRALTAAIEQVQHADEDVARLCARYGDSLIRSHLLDAHRFAARMGGGEPRFVLPAEAIEAGCHADSALLGHLYTAFHERYERLKIQAGGLDFDDLQLFALRLLEHDDVVTQIRGEVQRVLVDEYQDTDELQSTILRRIAGRELFTVGDEWQSIYRFRGADVDVFRRRAQEIDPLPVGGNYRSLPAVIDTVNHVFAHSFGDDFRPIAAYRKEEPAEQPACHLTLVRKGEGDFREVEAAVVAARIADLVNNRGVPPEHIGVLIARRKHGRTFERAIRDAGVKVVCQASGGFYDTWEIRDAMALLAWSANRYDDAAALAVLSSPLFGASWLQLLELREQDEPVYDALLRQAAADNVEAIRALRIRDQIAAVGENAGLADAVDYAVRGTGFDLQVALATGARARLANLRKLVELAAIAGSVGVTGIAAFAELVEAQKSLAAQEGEAVVADEASGAVRIMTVHQSKGLEFDHVFVCDLGGRGSLAHPTALFVRDQTRPLSGSVAIQGVTADGSATIVGERLEALRVQSKLDDAAEQSRLLYVAMTRAKLGLHMIGSFGVNPKGTARIDGHLMNLCAVFNIDPTTCESLTRIAGLSLEIDVVTDGWASASPEAQPTAADSFETNPIWHGSDAVGAPTEVIRGGAGAHPIARETVRDAVGAERGTRLHAALALRMADPSADISSLVEEDEAATIAAVEATPTFAEHRNLGARAEFPFQVVLDGQLVNGRFDACAICGTNWHILDYKLTLPTDRDAAWELHGVQMTGYLRAAQSGGATTVHVTLISIQDPATSHSWTFTDS